MGDTGLEPVTTTGCKTKHLQQRPPMGGAESGAVVGRTAPSDPDLAKVIEVWPTLPDPIKRAIMAMIDACG